MGHSHSEPHVSPLSLYLKVFSALIFLTFVTVGVSYLGLPPSLSIIVALAVACLKGTLVATWFMHLLHDTKFNIMLFLASLWFIGVFFTLTSVDLLSRGRIIKFQDTFGYRNDVVSDIKISDERMKEYIDKGFKSVKQARAEHAASEGH
jgi:caa(3)-type oxidase subunit IV